MIKLTQYRNYILLLFILLNTMAVKAETVQQSAMKKLSFLVGSWAGDGQSFDDKGGASSYYDTEDVWFDVQESVLIIQAKGFRNNEQFYGIHTVIYYDEENKHYWYNPYTAKGARPFSCTLSEQVFACLTESETFRLTFQRTKNGLWNEFGERLVDGTWHKTFETRLKERE
ncbi:hypothetical protein J3L16_07245 [Alteromonas sp. 5E99-2]|uniref:hypothetical protein n=1 Tax=Alteromonas sp. 5E99-2 TaxID=2817683 RepID=UPI001A9889E2|nr:hypothetical protein [Alteromonas sp. 5E99-2]MBO1255478.1 hypothetical protein [Alteromonas sp. 5E99-2]